VDEEFENLKKNWEERGDGWMVLQREKAPKTGHIHLQGMIHCSVPRDFIWVRENVSKHTYYKKCPKTLGRVCMYCTKSETRVDGPYYWGIDKGYVLWLIEEGKTLKELIRDTS